MQGKSNTERLKPTEIQLAYVVMQWGVSNRSLEKWRFIYATLSHKRTSNSRYPETSFLLALCFDTEMYFTDVGGLEENICH